MMDHFRFFTFFSATAKNISLTHFLNLFIIFQSINTYQATSMARCQKSNREHDTVRAPGGSQSSGKARRETVSSHAMWKGRIESLQGQRKLLEGADVCSDWKDQRDVQVQSANSGGEPRH